MPSASPIKLLRSQSEAIEALAVIIGQQAAARIRERKGDTSNESKREKKPRTAGGKQAA